MTQEKLLEVKNLKKHFPVGRKEVVTAVDGVSFDIHKGETFGLVGESGCGKSTTGRTIIRLYDATSGEVKFNGEDVHGKKSKKELLKFNRKMQMIFQDPSSRSEEHTSELQSRGHLVCRLLLAQKHWTHPLRGC